MNTRANLSTVTLLLNILLKSHCSPKSIDTTFLRIKKCSKHLTNIRYVFQILFIKIIRNDLFKKSLVFYSKYIFFTFLKNVFHPKLFLTYTIFIHYYYYYLHVFELFNFANI